MNATSPITTHILDISHGRPATGLEVRLELCDAAGKWRIVGEGVTNGDGRVADLMEPSDFTPGTYRLTFATGDYFSVQGRKTFYPQVVVEFLVTATEDRYHVPLLLSQFGYSTYRGN